MATKTKKPKAPNYAAILFGRRVRHYRMTQKMSLRGLAEQCGINHACIVQIEAGRVEPNLITAFKLAEILNFHFDDLRNAVIHNKSVAK